MLIRVDEYKEKALEHFEERFKKDIIKLSLHLDKTLSNGFYQIKTESLPEPFNKAWVIHGVESRYLINLGLVPVPDKFNFGDYNSYNLF